VRRGGSSTRSKAQLARPNGLLSAVPPGAYFGPLPLGGHPLKASEVAEGEELRGQQKEEMGEEEETGQKQELEFEDYITSCNKVRPREKSRKNFRRL
jgi:hypothetical protein